MSQILKLKFSLNPTTLKLLVPSPEHNLSSVQLRLHSSPLVVVHHPSARGRRGRQRRLIRHHRRRFLHPNHADAPVALPAPALRRPCQEDPPASPSRPRRRHCSHRRSTNWPSSTAPGPRRPRGRAGGTADSPNQTTPTRRRHGWPCSVVLHLGRGNGAHSGKHHFSDKRHPRR